MSFLGYLVQKIHELPEERGLEFDKLSDFTKIVFDDIKLDMHKE